MNARLPIDSCYKPLGASLMRLNKVPARVVAEEVQNRCTGFLEAPPGFDTSALEWALKFMESYERKNKHKDV